MYSPSDPDPPVEKPEPSSMPISEFILTALRTALDVVRNMNKQRQLQRTIKAAANSTAIVVSIPLT